jgi:hypothetical protein
MHARLTMAAECREVSSDYRIETMVPEHFWLRLAGSSQSP